MIPVDLQHPMGRLRRRISDWANSSDQHARDLRKEYASERNWTIAETPDRERVQLVGTIRSIVLRPRGGVPALEAELYDGTGVVILVWLGRRRIVGIEAGRSVAVEGRIGVQDGHRLMYNPRYELQP